MAFHITELIDFASGFGYVGLPKPEITICLELLRWWYISVIRLACNDFMMLNFTSTLTSSAATPLFNY